MYIKCAVAKNALLQKKRLTQQLSDMDGQLTNLEMQREMLENAASTQQMLDVFKDTSDTLKKVHKNMYVLRLYFLQSFTSIYIMVHVLID